MGANHRHEIEKLCAIARPDFGLITNIGRSHLEGFGGPEGVRKGKERTARLPGREQRHGIPPERRCRPE
ncbi:MAG: Mur ligase family protein [Alistipes indistinctus]